MHRSIHIFHEVINRKGLGFVVKFISEKAIRFAFYDLWVRLLFKPRTFRSNGKVYRYLNSFYGPSWQSERCIEIALGLAEIKSYKDILEIGNVLSHYLADKPGENRVVIDKYEKSSGVINEDVISFDLGRQFDLIISISTLEHVGYDENESPEKIFSAIHNLRKHLKENGKIFITLPVGQNPPLDSYISTGRLRFKSLRYMKRISRSNIWIDTTKEDAMSCLYGKPYPHANALIICED